MKKFILVIPILLLAMLACSSALSQTEPTTAPTTQALAFQLKMPKQQSMAVKRSLWMFAARSLLRLVTLQARSPFRWINLKLISATSPSKKISGSSPTAPDKMNIRAPVRRSFFCKMDLPVSIRSLADYLPGQTQDIQLSHSIK